MRGYCAMMIIILLIFSLLFLFAYRFLHLFLGLSFFLVILNIVLFCDIIIGKAREFLLARCEESSTAKNCGVVLTEECSTTFFLLLVDSLCIPDYEG